MISQSSRGSGVTVPFSSIYSRASSSTPRTASIYGGAGSVYVESQGNRSVYIMNSN